MTLSREDIARIKHKMYGAIHNILDGMEAQLDPPEDPLRTALLRQASDIVGLWDWCGSSACFRARRCRRSHGDCYAHGARLLPKEMQAGVIARLRALPPLRAARKQLFPSSRARKKERSFVIPGRERSE
jgi:hypothetical protein